MLTAAEPSSTRSLCVSPLCHNYKSRRRSARSLSMNPLFSRTFISCSSFNCFTVQASSSLQIEGTLNDLTVDHNFEILRFCEAGNLEKAMELLLQWEKIDLDVRTYCSILQLCAEFKALDWGKKVHSVVRARNIIIDCVLGSKLVFMYVSCGDLKEGRRIFDKTANENVFLWNLLMNEYAKMGNFKESVYLYYRMTELGVEANSYTFSCVLKCFAALGSLDEGKMIHGYLLKSGFHNSTTTVINSLISLYFKTGRTESAQKLFDELSDRDVVSWNSMISGFIANGVAQQGVKVFIEMLSLGVGVDLATIVIVLAACAKTDNLSFTRSVHAYAIKAGFDMKINFSNSLLDTYSKCGDMQGAVCVFRRMPDRSIVSWTSMLAGYARQGLYNEAVVLFQEMRKKDIEIDAFAVTSILHACACSGSLENGKEVHNYIKESNMGSSLFVSNALVDMYAKCGSMEDAKMVFSQMRVKDIVSWNTIIGGFSKNSLHNEALDLFVEMQSHIRPDFVTITCILPACASLAALDKGREIHGYVMRSGFSLDPFVCNALLDMYVKCGALLVAKLLFDKIASKDLVSWTTMIAGYGMYGFGTEAVATFNKMRQAGIMPDEVSFTCILHSCSHSGSLEEGWKFFDIMRKEYGIEAKLEHYACMVDLLARAGRLLEAYKFIRKMPVQPDAAIWGALLSGCRIHHDVQLGEEVADHIFELEPENTSYYILLANIYAEAEKWEEVKKMREKNTGCSWIEIKGKVDVFVSGDNFFPEAKRIQAFLKRMKKKMKEEEGYSSRVKYGLIKAANDDDREKEIISACGHSEKLAMAFGIMKLPRGKVIRVTKNIRVCGDCHEMAKFMSKSLGREIVLRDSNRFHYFRHGSCSCRDYS